jgi:hypothetical protein
MLMNPPERIQAEEVGVIRGNGNIRVELGQCAKEGPHNGSKCLTSYGGTLRDVRSRRKRRNDRRAWNCSHPWLTCWARGVLCSVAQSLSPSLSFGG